MKAAPSLFYVCLSVCAQVVGYPQVLWYPTVIPRYLGT